MACAVRTRPLARGRHCGRRSRAARSRWTPHGGGRAHRRSPRVARSIRLSSPAWQSLRHEMATTGARCSRRLAAVKAGGGDSPGGNAGDRAASAVDLYWLPLGAGGHSVRLNGRLYEAVAARLQRRPACDLYHSALQVEVPGAQYVIEQAPVHDWSGNERGVVAEGAVGSRWAGRFRIFRYEIRLWRGGHIPDVAEAVDSPRRLTSDEDRARRVLDLVAQVPTPVWGRDELATGEMWNSNSVIAWVIARSGIDTEAIKPPTGGRAPGWQAGLVGRTQIAPGPDPGRAHDLKLPFGSVRSSGWADGVRRPRLPRGLGRLRASGSWRGGRGGRAAANARRVQRRRSARAAAPLQAAGGGAPLRRRGRAQRARP